jgi:hypothetical protein
MKMLLAALCLFPTLLYAQDTHREATPEEAKIILPKEEADKLKVLGTELTHESERQLINEAMVRETMTNGKIDEVQIKNYIQRLTDQGLKPEQIDHEIDHLSRKYFADLQIKDLENVLTPEKQKEYEAKFNALQVKSEAGTLTHEQLDREISLLDSEISNSESTKNNENKMKEFKNLFMETKNKNTFVKSSPPISDKQFSPMKIMVPTNFSLKNYRPEDPLCLSDSQVSHNSQINQFTDQMNSITTSGKGDKPFIHQIYFAWGYNRNYHTGSDVKFTTPDGTFTIHDAQSKDRPSPFSVKDYFNPSNLSIPQYNMELGLMFNEKWGLEMKQDHMKMVFDNTRPYEITGDYSHQVVIKNENPTSEWDKEIPVDFSVAKAKKDATWLKWEHTDGYNYVSLGAVYNQNLYKTKNEKFKIDGRFGAGAGLMIPKTDVSIHQDKQWNYIGKNNRFHVAGGGVHAEAKLRLTFWNSIFLQAATRGTYIKVKDALVDGTSSRMEHIQPMASLQIMGQIGYTYTFKTKKKIPIPKS